MEKRIENILLTGKQILQSLKPSEVSVLAISIYHSTQVTLQLHSGLANKPCRVTCDYCTYFKGNVNIWKNVSLSLEYKQESLKFRGRTIEDYLFELRDLGNDYFIRCKNLLYDELSEENSLAQGENEISRTNVHNVESDINIEQINAVLQEYKKSRVRIINSDKNLLNVRLDNNTEERFLNFSKQTQDRYKLDSTHFLDILCHNPVFLCADFQSWEITEPLKLYKEQDFFTLIDAECKFKIKCDLIEINK